MRAVNSTPVNVEIRGNRVRVQYANGTVRHYPRPTR